MLLHASVILAFLGLFLWSPLAVAETDRVGGVATLEGTVEIGRGGTWEPAAPGADVYTGDRLRTGKPGRARIVFHDDSVLVVGDSTEIRIEMSTSDAADGPVDFLLNVIVGKVRALVSEHYQDPLASFQIETATGVSAVRSTEFVVAYDATAQRTEVLGLEGKVEVHGVIDRRNRGVLLTSLLYTQVAKGGYPTPPQTLSTDSDTYRRLMSDVGFVAEGQPESLSRIDGKGATAPDSSASSGTGSGTSLDSMAVLPGTDSPGETPGVNDAPPIDLGRDPIDRTPGQVIDEPTGPLGNGGAEVEF